MAGCRYRQEAASWQSSLDGNVCPRATTPTGKQASLSNSGIFKHSAAAPVHKSMSGRTRQSNYFSALR